MAVLLVADLLPVVTGLSFKLLVPSVLQVFKQTAMTLFFRGQLVTVPFVKLRRLISLLVEVGCVLVGIAISLLKVRCFSLVDLLSQVSILVVASLNLLVGPSFLLVELV